jgi:hypothetical protein
MKTLENVARLLGIAGTVALCFFTIRLSAAEVPVAVLKAFKATYPSAKIKGKSIEKEKGQTLYEIESVEGKTKRDLLYTADGKVFEIEEAIAADSLPDAVRKTITTQFPGYHIAKAERITQADTVRYEVLVAEKKKQKELLFINDGTIVTMESIGKKEASGSKNGSDAE